MINICYIVDAPYAGGAERYVALLASHLDRRRFKPHVLFKSGTKLEQWRDQLEKCGVTTIDLPMDLPYRPGGIPRIIETLGSLNPHVVHVNMPGPYDAQMGLLVPLSRWAGSERVVVTEHLPMVEWLWKRALLKKLSYFWMDKMITVCEANIPYLVNRQAVRPDSIEVVHNALPVTYGKKRAAQRAGVREELHLSKETVAVCIIGTLIKRKGHVLLIEALAQLPDLPWHLVIIGDGEERGACETAIAGNNLRNRATFVGSRTAEEVERLLAGMDVLTLPSYMEAFPYAILEAMACSLPVIASRIYGIPEAAVDGETSLLFEPRDRNGLRDALESLIGDEEMRIRFGSNGRERFEELFTLDVQLDRIQSIYLDVLYR